MKNIFLIFILLFSFSSHLTLSLTYKHLQFHQIIIRFFPSPSPLLNNVEMKKKWNNEIKDSREKQLQVNIFVTREELS